MALILFAVENTGDLPRLSEDTLDTVIPEAELGVSPDGAEGPTIASAVPTVDGDVKDGEAMLLLMDAAEAVAVAVAVAAAAAAAIYFLY